MELILYIVLLTTASLFSLRREMVGPKLFSLIFGIVYSVHVLVIRLVGFEEDIEVYSERMSIDGFSLYYWKEPVVWIGQRFLFRFLHSEFLVFLVFDLVAGVVLFFGLKRWKVPQYAYFSVLTFFPFVLGFQNIYRQWYSEIVFLFGVSLVGVRSTRPYFVLLASTLSHNVAGLFLPLFFLTRPRATKLIGWFFLIATPATVVLASGTKSSASTGLSLGFAYLLLFGLILFLRLLVDHGYVKRENIFVYEYFVFSFFISVVSVALLSSAGGERVGMFALVVSYPVIVLTIEKGFRPRPAVRAGISILGFLPVLVFGTRDFIL